MQKIILRLDLNVPRNLEKTKILDKSKIEKILPDLKRLLKTNEIAVLSHLGKGEKNDNLKLVESALRKSLTKEENQKLTILDNTRWQKGETTKVNSLAWNQATKYFAKFGEEYIDDAFSVMHRDNASVVGIPKLFKKQGKKVALGNQAKQEIKILNKYLKLIQDPKKPTLVILSGAKINSKLPLIKKFLKLKAKVFLSGGIANQIFKEVLNYNIGKSYLQKDFKFSKTEKKYLLKEFKNGNLILPIDVILKDKTVNLVEKLKKNDYIADLGPASLVSLKNLISKSQNIILNGPLGVYEEGFTLGTKALLKFLKTTNKEILLGGGDTLVLINKLKIKDTAKLHISLGGGAMLEFLIKDGKLPGILAIT